MSRVNIVEAIQLVCSQQAEKETRELTERDFGVCCRRRGILCSVGSPVSGRCACFVDGPRVREDGKSSTVIKSRDRRTIILSSFVY